MSASNPHYATSQTQDFEQPMLRRYDVEGQTLCPQLVNMGHRQQDGAPVDQRRGG